MGLPFLEGLSKKIFHRKDAVPTVNPSATTENNVAIDASGMASLQVARDAAAVPTFPDAMDMQAAMTANTPGARPAQSSESAEALAAKVMEDASAVAASTPASEAPKQPVATSNPVDKAA